MGENKKSLKLPKGVTIRDHGSGSTINISFTFHGVRCREPLSNISISAQNIKYAARLLGEIHNKIERGTFNYADHFPQSSKLKIFGTAGRGSTVKNYLDKYLELCAKRELSPSSINGYKKCMTALSSLHDICINELTPAIIKAWVQHQTTAIKTIRNQLSFLKSAIDDAIIDSLITINPVTVVSVSRYHSNNINKNTSYIVDPFQPDEVNAILSNCANEPIENLFGFNFSTGMRPSELCAAKWSNVNFIKKTYLVDAASVVGVEKGTKTLAGTRVIELSDNAVKYLLRQKKYTFLSSDYIFLDPKTYKPWASADAIRKKAWVPTLKRSGINYRNPYQMRHTFATKLISQGVNLFWLATQMGHKGPEMLFRHYGKYLKEYDGNTSVQKTVNK